MNRRFFLGGGTAVAVVGGSSLINFFSRAHADVSVAQLVSTDTPKLCSVPVSAAPLQNTASLVDNVRSHLRGADLMQNFTGAEDFHAFVEHLYRAAAIEDEGELAEAYHMIVEDTACHTPDMPEDMEQCDYAEAWKLYANLQALQVYPADGSIAFDTLPAAQQSIVASATSAFAGMIMSIYPALSQRAWPGNELAIAADALFEGTHALEESLIAENTCILPAPVPAQAAPASPPEPPVQETPTQRAPTRRPSGPVMHA